MLGWPPCAVAQNGFPTAVAKPLFDAETAASALIEHKEHTNMKPKNTICSGSTWTRRRRRTSTSPLSG